MVKRSYYTVANSAIQSSEVRRSRFIAAICPIKDTANADEFLQQRRKEDWRANHHCYAYTIGLQQEIQKASDDGEPAGTAGVPILDVLKRHKICNTLIVVTRYFGGIKLGTGGLIRAYSHSASSGIAAAGIIEQIPSILWSVTIDYHLQGLLEAKLRESPYPIKDVNYSDRVRYNLYTRQDQQQLFTDWLTDLTNGQAKIQKKAELYRQRAVQPEEMGIISS